MTSRFGLEVLLSCAMASPVFAALPRLVVQERDSSGTLIATTYDDTPATIESAINLLDATARVNIFMEYASPSDTAVPVGFMDFNPGSSPQGQISFVVGEGAFDASDTEVSLGNAMRCSTWRGFTAPTGVDCRLYGRLNGDLIGSGTSGFTNDTFLNVDTLSFLVIDGQLNARVNISAPASTFFAVHAGLVGQHGRIELQSGTINRVRVVGDVNQPSASGVASISAGAGNINLVDVGGSLRGDVICRGTAGSSTQGRIAQIIVGDHIGRTFTSNSAGDPESATAFPYLNPGVLNGAVLCIEATNGINLVEADTMTCLIESDRQPSGPDATGKLESVVTRTGSFKGLLQVQGLQDNDSGTGGASVDIAGDFRGRVRMDPPSEEDGAFIGLFKVRSSLLPLTLTDSMSNTAVQKAFVL